MWPRQIYLFVCCVSEDHLRVAAAVAVLRRRVITSTKSQRLCDSWFLAQVWCFHGNSRCCAAHHYQLLFLEEDAQVRPLCFALQIRLKIKPKVNLRKKLWHTLTRSCHSLPCRLQYKYSKLMMNSGGKECELPTADSCAIMEGEDAEDDIMYLSKRSVFSKMRSYSREVSNNSIHTHSELCMRQLLMICVECFQRSSDGFDSVPLKSSSSRQHREEDDSDDD